MSAVPTFHLSACPVCSSLALAERPHWRMARLTTRKTGTPCYILTGCKHSDAFSLGKIRSDPEEWDLVEETWLGWCAEAFAEKTAGWPVIAIDKLRRVLDDQHTLPGATAPLPLTPAEPVNEQHEPDETI